MFSYCKRCTVNNEAAYDYQMTMNKPPKKATPCHNLGVPYVQYRGIPVDLVDLNSQIKGQDSRFQTFCKNEETECDNNIDLSEFRKFPHIPKLGACPITTVEMNALFNDDNNNSFSSFSGLNAVKPSGYSLGVVQSQNDSLKLRK